MAKKVILMTKAKVRGPRPKHDKQKKYVYDRELGWLSPKQVIDLRKETYGVLKEQGFKDHERIGPDGDIDRRYMLGPNRHVHIHDYIQAGDTFDVPDTLNKWHSSERALRHDCSVEAALCLLRARAPWAEIGVAAMAALGFSERDTADALGITRHKVRNLLEPFQMQTNTKLAQLLREQEEQESYDDETAQARWVEDDPLVEGEYDYDSTLHEPDWWE